MFFNELSIDKLDSYFKGNMNELENNIKGNKKHIESLISGTEQIIESYNDNRSKECSRSRISNHFVENIS